MTIISVVSVVSKIITQVIIGVGLGLGLHRWSNREHQQYPSKDSVDTDEWPLAPYIRKYRRQIENNEEYETEEDVQFKPINVLKAKISDLDSFKHPRDDLQQFVKFVKICCKPEITASEFMTKCFELKDNIEKHQNEQWTKSFDTYNIGRIQIEEICTKCWSEPFCKELNYVLGKHEERERLIFARTMIRMMEKEGFKRPT